jgi:hypothetical protein
MLFNMDEGNTRKRRHDVRRASQLLPLARSLYLSAISCILSLPLLLTNFLTPTDCKHISHLMHCNDPQVMRRKLQERDRIIHPRSADVFIPAAIDRPPSMSI